MKEQVLMLQLNEINFDLVKEYIANYNELPNFKRVIFEFVSLETYGEQEYDLLEPWIQWVSAQTGLTYEQHGVFRLGDIVKAPETITQIFEELELHGLKVGAISPMNARNRLKNPAYFIPDPWTNTPSDKSGFSRRLTSMLNQTVNDNAAQKITLKSIFTLAEAVIRTFDPMKTANVFSNVFQSIKKPWYRALVLDRLIHLVHLKLLRTAKPDVSFIFLNAGAHIQHHYLLNSPFFGSQFAKNPEWYVEKSEDPVRDMLKCYDEVLGDYLTLLDSGARIMIATGLTQVPYDRVKYYYRLKDHEKFLAKLNIDFDEVFPRMTRDFSVTFATELQAIEASDFFKGLRVGENSEPLFGVADVQGRSVFVTLTYPNEIVHGDIIVSEKGIVIEDLLERVSFVAVKNGMHSTKGYAFFSHEFEVGHTKESISVSTLYDLSKKYVGMA